MPHLLMLAYQTGHLSGCCLVSDSLQVSYTDMEPSIDLEALIHKYRQGSKKGYEEFVSIFTNPNTKEEILFRAMKSLKNCVALLDVDHEMLVGVVLKVDWTSKEGAFPALYQSFILNLISVHTDYLQAVLRMIIKSFFPVLEEPIEKTDTSSQLPPDVVSKHNVKFIKLHNLLRAITDIVPLSSSLLLPLLTDMFPFMMKGAYVHECYVKNVFEMTYYLPKMRQSVMELVIDKLIKLDVRAPRSVLLESKPPDESDESGIFHMDEPSSGVCVEGHTLDVMMVLVFQYIHNTCYTQDKLDWEATKKLYREMLYVFEKKILPTYASCHVQFVMFYLASMRSEICDGFLDYLWKIVQDPNQQAVFRQSAVAYIGSLLARGKFVSIVTVMKVMELIMQWVHHYIAHCQECLMADVTHHGPFYSVCQTVFYVFAFRQKDIFEGKKGLKWAESLHLQHLVQSRLNPLKVCFPIIVKTFASIARQHQLAFCDHIIQQNTRSFLPVVSNGVQKILESFFPFDPYVLKLSSHFVEPHYREYDQTLKIDDESSEDEDDDEMFSEDIGQSVSKPVAMSPTPMSYIDKVDLMSYGTSPGFKH